MSFNKDVFFNSEYYKQLTYDCDENSKVKNEIDRLIHEFVKWAESPYGEKDLCLTSQSREMPETKLWGSDFPKGVFRRQVGTTKRKFSLTSISTYSNDNLRDFAEVFSKCGVTTFVAQYTFLWSTNEFKSEFILLEQMNGFINKDYPDEDMHTHICLMI